MEIAAVYRRFTWTVIGSVAALIAAGLTAVVSLQRASDRLEVRFETLAMAVAEIRADVKANNAAQDNHRDRQSQQLAELLVFRGRAETQIEQLQETQRHDRARQGLEIHRP